MARGGWQKRQPGSEPNSAPPPPNGTTTQPTVPTEVPSFVVWGGGEGGGCLFPQIKTTQLLAVPRPQSLQYSLHPSTLHRRPSESSYHTSLKTPGLTYSTWSGSYSFLMELSRP